MCLPLAVYRTLNADNVVRHTYRVGPCLARAGSWHTLHLWCAPLTVHICVPSDTVLNMCRMWCPSRISSRVARHTDLHHVGHRYPVALSE